MGNQLGKGRDPSEEKAKVPRNELGAAAVHTMFTWQELKLQFNAICNVG